jgi:protocatechuate 3,4-dioxygenase beta subunit
MKSVWLVSLSASIALQLQTPTGGIEGTVSRRGSAEPLANARVTVTRRPGPVQQNAAPPAPIPAVTTDGKGKFAVTGLDEGVYGVQVSANGYVGQRYGEITPNSRASGVTVTRGQVTKDINVALMPAASISGRVRDTSEQPLINVPVQLLRYAYNPFGQRRYMPVAKTQTDDRGEYRMYWVTPGRYHVLAGSPSASDGPVPLASADGANGSDTPSEIGYAFYPGSTDLGNALPIELQPAADLRSIDIAVRTAPRTFSIRGKLIDSGTGQAPTTARVFVAPQSPELASGQGNGPQLMSLNQNYKGTDGTFEIRNLLPGTYSLLALATVPGPNPYRASGMMPVTIAAGDVNGITLPVSPGASILGRLRIDGELPPEVTITRAAVRMVPATIGQVANLNPAAEIDPLSVAADGSFRVDQVPPGDYLIEVVGLPPNLGYLKESRLDAVDILDTPLRVSNSSNKQLELVFRVGVGRVNGTVTDSRSQPVPGARVVIVPDRGRFRAYLYRAAITGQTGQFTFPPLAPGDYKVFAWEGLEDYAWFDPDLLARSEQRAHTVRVSESSTASIEVKIIPSEGSR